MDSKRIELIFIALVVILGIFYMYLSAKTPMLGEDEANYMKMARQFSALEYPQTDVFGRQLSFAPFVPLLMTSGFFVFGESLAIGKVISAIFGLLTILIVYLISRKEGVLAGICSSVLLLSIPFFTHSMMLLYLEIPIAFFSALALYMFLGMDSTKKAIMLGAIMGLASYVKFSGIFLAYALFAYTMIYFIVKRDKKLLKLMAIALAVTAIVVLPWLIKNMIVYNFPYVEGVNYLFLSNAISHMPEWIMKITSQISPSVDYNFYFGQLILILAIIGSVYSVYAKDKKAIISSFLVVLFFAVYFLRSSTGVEPRYFSIIFPQVAIIGGVYLSKISHEFRGQKSMVRYSVMILILVILAWSVFSSYGIAASTSASSRYPSNYVDALTWIRGNTPRDAVIFTPLGGSVIQFSDRDSLWSNTVEEFPQVMSTDDVKYIHDNLKKYNATDILVWRDVVAYDYIVPGSNFLGLFTYRFVNALASDQNQTMFTPLYSNQDTIIYHIQ
jgi:4-amino-4-deoxy-L-arabinose transferase-like glycosyltransferase